MLFHTGGSTPDPRGHGLIEKRLILTQSDERQYGAAWSLTHEQQSTADLFVADSAASC